MVKQTSKAKENRSKERNDRVLVHRGVGLPPRFEVTLRASTAWNLNHAGTLQTAGVTCNDPYRPFVNFTTAEIPAYLTYLSLAYDQLFVLRSRISVELINSTVADSIATCLAFDSNVAGTPSFDDLAESRDAQSRMIGYYSAGNNMARFQGTYNPMRYQGMSANSPDNMCKAGAAPPNTYFWLASIRSVAGGTGNVGARIVVEYDVAFVELKQPSP